MIRLTLVLTAVLVATSSAPAWTQRAAHDREHLKVHVSTDAPLTAIHNARAVTRGGSVASGGRVIIASGGRIETARELKANEVRDVTSSAVSFSLPVRIRGNPWICIHREGMGP